MQACTHACLLGMKASCSTLLLQVRDITADDKWFSAYQYEIPVLAR